MSREVARWSYALQLGYLAKFGRSPMCCRGTQHEYATVVEHQLAVPHRPVAMQIACPAGWVKPNTLMSNPSAAASSSYRGSE